MSPVGEQWRGRSSEIHAGIRRCGHCSKWERLVFHGVLSWKQGRKLVESPRLSARFRRLYSNAPRDNRRVDGKAACRLINVEPFMGVTTEGHLSGFLNYLVRKFSLVEFPFEWEKGFRNFSSAKRHPMRHVLNPFSKLNFSLGPLFYPLIFLGGLWSIVLFQLFVKTNFHLSQHEFFTPAIKFVQCVHRSFMRLSLFYISI